MEIINWRWATFEHFGWCDPFVCHFSSWYIIVLKHFCVGKAGYLKLVVGSRCHHIWGNWKRLQGQKAKENNRNIWSITLLVKLSVAPSVTEWFLAHLISIGRSTCFSKQNGSKNDVYTTCEQAKWVLQFFFLLPWEWHIPGTSLVGSMVKNPPWIWGMWIRSLVGKLRSHMPQSN